MIFTTEWHVAESARAPRTMRTRRARAACAHLDDNVYVIIFSTQSFKF